MAFSERVVTRLNGWGQVFRFITPLMVGLLLAQYNFNAAQQEKFRDEIRGSIFELSRVMNMHLQQEVPVMRERIGKLETRLRMDYSEP
jgi:hypothetical protein